MLKIDKSISLTGYCVVNEAGVNTNVVYLNVSISTGGVSQDYVTNTTNIIKYFNPYTGNNGTTPEEVLDENGNYLGSLILVQL